MWSYSLNVHREIGKKNKAGRKAGEIVVGAYECTNLVQLHYMAKTMGFKMELFFVCFNKETSKFCA